MSDSKLTIFGSDKAILWGDIDYDFSGLAGSLGRGLKKPADAGTTYRLGFSHISDGSAAEMGLRLTDRKGMPAEWGFQIGTRTAGNRLYRSDLSLVRSNALGLLAGHRLHLPQLKLFESADLRVEPSFSAEIDLFRNDVRLAAGLRLHWGATTDRLAAPWDNWRLGNTVFDQVVLGTTAFWMGGRLSQALTDGSDLQAYLQYITVRSVYGIDDYHPLALGETQRERWDERLAHDAPFFNEAARTRSDIPEFYLEESLYNNYRWGIGTAAMIGAIGGEMASMDGEMLSAAKRGEIGKVVPYLAVGLKLLGGGVLYAVGKREEVPYPNAQVSQWATPEDIEYMRRVSAGYQTDKDRYEGGAKEFNRHYEQEGVLGPEQVEAIDEWERQAGSFSHKYIGLAMLTSGSLSVIQELSGFESDDAYWMGATGIAGATCLFLFARSIQNVPTQNSHTFPYEIDMKSYHHYLNISSIWAMLGAELATYTVSSIASRFRENIGR